jgi:hypothetical protein
MTVQCHLQEVWYNHCKDTNFTFSGICDAVPHQMSYCIMKATINSQIFQAVTSWAACSNASNHTIDGHLNITHDFGQHGRLPGIYLPYTKFV